MGHNRTVHGVCNCNTTCRQHKNTGSSAADWASVFRFSPNWASLKLQIIGNFAGMNGYLARLDFPTMLQVLVINSARRYCDPLCLLVCSDWIGLSRV